MWNSSSPKLFNAKATSQDGTCPAGKSKFSTLKLMSELRPVESEWFRLARCHDGMPCCAMTIRWHKVILKIRWRLHMKHVVMTSLKEREWVSFRRCNSAPQKDGVALWCKPLCGIWSLLPISDLILCNAFFWRRCFFWNRAICVPERQAPCIHHQLPQNWSILYVRWKESDVLRY